YEALDLETCRWRGPVLVWVVVVDAIPGGLVQTDLCIVGLRQVRVGRDVAIPNDDISVWAAGSDVRCNVKAMVVLIAVATVRTTLPRIWWPEGNEPVGKGVIDCGDRCRGDVPLRLTKYTRERELKARIPEGDLKSQLRTACAVDTTGRWSPDGNYVW